ncbi:cyclic nucleotide-binding domain-containing protein [Marinobacteraceae bacterium S3BR75-40.1]
MQLVDTPSEELNALGQKVTQASHKLFASIRMLCQELTLDSVDDLFHEVDGDNLYFVEDGILEAVSGDNTVYYLEPGDLVGMQKLGNQRLPLIRANAAVKLARIDQETFQEAAGTSPQFKHYLMLLATFFAEACCQQDGEQTGSRPEFKTFKADEVIIQEGDPADEVYDLISGEATVYVKGQEVGKVAMNEIFGAMAALTKTPRTATVVATKPCTCVAVPVDEFISLIRSQPRTSLSLMENMANQILAMNQKLVDVIQKD